MLHPETRRLVPGAKYAVLFLHGIVGTPNQFRVLLPLEELVPESWSVYNLRYPGHGDDVRDFGRSSMELWRTYAAEAFLELAEKHEKVVLVGHSMGTLFALRLAVLYPAKTAALFLLNVPLRPWMRMRCMVNCLRIAFGCIREDHMWESCFQKACGITPTPLVWRYIPWIPRILELFAEISRTEKLLDRLNVPCVAWQAEKDELVSNRTAPVLRKSGVMDVRELKNSTHFYYPPEEQEMVRNVFLETLRNE